METAIVSEFCDLIRRRSAENKNAIDRLSNDMYSVLSPAFSILRQELDSMVRAIYLLHLQDNKERLRLMSETIDGHKWTTKTKKGKYRKITDKELVEISQNLQGWTRYVYRFGCAFIHLSEFHNHSKKNPFESLNSEEKQDVLSYLRHYHGVPPNDELNMRELSRYLPGVFQKISSNLECYLADIEK